MIDRKLQNGDVLWNCDEDYFLLFLGNANYAGDCFAVSDYFTLNNSYFNLPKDYVMEHCIYVSPEKMIQVLLER